MPSPIRVFQVDAFTAVAGGGNPAMVALEAQHLDEGAMQRIAAAHHHGDWAFALPASRPDVDLDVRFFSPRKELPFVGHATLALHAVLDRQQPRTLRRQLGRTGVVGIQRLDTGDFSIQQAAPPLGREVGTTELPEILDLLGLDARHLHPQCPPRIAGGSSTRLLLGLADAAALDALAPRMQELADLSPRIGAQGYFLFAPSMQAGELHTEARMFCPAIGIDEDPVSGNAHAMLGVYLLERGLLPLVDRSARFSGRQGRHVGRPGQVKVTVELGADNQPATASIAGSAVVGREQVLMPA